MFPINRARTTIDPKEIEHGSDVVEQVDYTIEYDGYFDDHHEIMQENQTQFVCHVVMNAENASIEHVEENSIPDIFLTRVLHSFSNNNINNHVSLMFEFSRKRKRIIVKKA